MRLILVWSSLSPVFLLWAIRGIDKIDDRYWIPACLAMFAIPTIILALMQRYQTKIDNSQTINIVGVREEREHLLTYLFAMLIPLFDANLEGGRDLMAVGAAFIFVLLLFWHMRLHYMNLYFALRGYRIFTVEVELSTTSNNRARKTLTTYAVLSKRHHIPENEPLTGIRLGGEVLIDKDEND
jgi:hypothetical protein